MKRLTIRQYLAGLGCSVPAEEIYGYISEWLEWYQNEVSRFHTYRIYDGVRLRSEKRYRLGMAKKVCEDWANLLLNEKVSIRAGDYDGRLREILERNNFRVRGNQLIELAFALGTGAFVEYRDPRGGVVIDYVRADMIYPISCENGDVTECAFGSYRNYGGRECIYIQLHRLGRAEDGENPGEYYLENRLADASSGAPGPCPEVMGAVIRTRSVTPLFQFITPNIVNNVDLDSPMGISVFANALDEIRACDLVFDSYINEFVLGRKRILVPISLARMAMERQENGGETAFIPQFDPSETVFYQMPSDRSSDLKPTEVDMTIRAAEHELGIQRALDLCSFKCGLGTKHYQFTGTAAKTATEVISDKSDLYQNLKKNEITVRAALVRMAQAVAFLDGMGPDMEVSVDFDDSVIEDTGAFIDRNLKLVQSGLRSRITAIMEITRCSEEEAKRELQRISGEAQATGAETDWAALAGGPL